MPQRRKTAQVVSSSPRAFHVASAPTRTSAFDMTRIVPSAAALVLTLGCASEQPMQATVADSGVLGAAGDSGASPGDPIDAGPSNAQAMGDGSSTAGNAEGGMAMPSTHCTLSCDLAQTDDGTPKCECSRQQGECSTDDDCVVAGNRGDCCGACNDAFPKSLVESEPCIVPVGEVVPPLCMPTPCDEPCPPVSCQLVARALCETGRCVWSEQCLEGDVLVGQACYRACGSNADCIIAVRSGGCCDSCPRVELASWVEAGRCVIPVDQAIPDQCRPPPESCPGECQDLGCPDPASLTPQCQPDGTCTG